MKFYQMQKQKSVCSFKSNLIISLIIFFSALLPASGQDLMNGDFWKRQVMQDILEPWTKNARDREFGSFHTILNQDWKKGETDEKYPGMIARHLFSYSVGYLLNGEAEHLSLARETFDYLVNHGWDQQYGGWFLELDRSGKVMSTDKDMFMHAYAITGLAMYYIVTRDPEVKKYLNRSIELFENHAWDKEHGGGYFKNLNRDFTIKNSDKVFSPQLAPVSGYLLYLYAATREEKYLRISERILDLALARMKDEESGWIMEGYDRAWQPIEHENVMMNTGHNVEVAWMLMRLYALNGKESYRQEALRLNDQLLKYTFDKDVGIWYHKIRVDSPEVHSDDSPWWVQAYGNMFQLYLYAHLKDEDYLLNFKKGAAFWNNHFVDAEKGGAYLSVGREGNIINGSKAVKTKTSYHSVENGLLKMLYLDYWVNNKPVTVFYHINAPVREKLYPLLLEDKGYEISQVLIDGKRWKKIDHKTGGIMLPSRAGYKMEVRLQRKQNL
jgi:cellobiose epimerase